MMRSSAVGFFLLLSSSGPGQVQIKDLDLVLFQFEQTLSSHIDSTHHRSRILFGRRNISFYFYLSVNYELNISMI